MTEAIKKEKGNAEELESYQKNNSSKLKEFIRVLKFIGFSVSAGVIEIVTFTLLNELVGWPYWPCYLIALVLSVLWNFTFNRKFTFKSANNVPIAMLKVAAYYVVFTPATTLLGNFLAESVGLNEYLVTGINMALNLSTEYLFQRFVVFRGSIDTNIKKKKDNEKETINNKEEIVNE
ncbi:MAG: GtrA family protein [Lachnospiraceae bacterium]|nr:GtrA family protein [Lachnospiraceae bacterium]